MNPKKSDKNIGEDEKDDLKGAYAYSPGELDELKPKDSESDNSKKPEGFRIAGYQRDDSELDELTSK